MPRQEVRDCRGDRHDDLRPPGDRRANRRPFGLRPHFCLYALSAVIPLLPAKQRKLPDQDWLEQETLVACPDAEERLIMRIERIGKRTMRSEDLT